MTSTVNRLTISLIGLAIGWVLALKALSHLGAWVTLTALAFLAAIAVGVLRAARV